MATQNQQPEEQPVALQGADYGGNPLPKPLLEQEIGDAPPTESDRHHPTFIKRGWYQDPYEGFSESQRSWDAEDLADACEQRGLEAEDEISTIEPEARQLDRSLAWDVQGADILDLDTELRSGRRQIPEVVDEVYYQTRIARPDLDVYVEPEPVTIAEDGSKATAGDAGAQQQWSVVADNAVEPVTARLTVHTSQNDSVIEKVSTTSGRVERFDWRDWQPERDIVTISEFENREIRGEELNEPQAWQQMRSHFAEQVKALPAMTKVDEERIIENPNRWVGGFDPKSDVYSEEFRGSTVPAPELQHQADMQQRTAAPAVGEGKQPEHEAGVEADVALQQQRQTPGMDGPSM